MRTTITLDDEAYEAALTLAKTSGERLGAGGRMGVGQEQGRVPAREVGEERVAGGARRVLHRRVDTVDVQDEDRPRRGDELPLCGDRALQRVEHVTDQRHARSLPNRSTA